MVCFMRDRFAQLGKEVFLPDGLFCAKLPEVLGEIPKAKWFSKNDEDLDAQEKVLSKKVQGMEVRLERYKEMLKDTAGRALALAPLVA